MQEFTPQNHRYAKLVDRYSRLIASPVLRLKFLNSALKSEPPRNRWMNLVPFANELPERAMVIAELSKVLPLDQPAPLGFRITSLLYRVRVAVYAVCLAVTLLAGATLVYAAAKIVNTLSVSTEAKNIGGANQSTASASGAAVAAIGAEAGLSLDNVWLAEQGQGYEFYSNGARVLTEMEIDGPRRNFYRFDLDALAAGADEAEPFAQPVGILYHVSESDLLPFADGYNKSLQDRSRGLLEYARTNRLYNYVIDRFGRTYRIVRDESAASHAGHSLWGDDRIVYVNLSASFIGVCFEGKSGNGTAMGADGINEAQIYAARVLTAVLRSKYEIDDANCVTHGLVSVNPSNRLMGYHTDWVSAFPFEALGLTNKYETKLCAVSRLGLGYDSAYVSAAGGVKWPGLARADSELREAAARHGVRVDVERRELSRLFQRAFNKQRELERKSMRSEH